MSDGTEQTTPPEQPVFSEPWQAQAFALTLQLHAAGWFSWQEWSRYLAETIRTDGRPDESGNDPYYRHWLTALEKLVMDKQLLSETEHRQRQQDWDDAARHTPHGQPITLKQTRRPRR